MSLYVADAHVPGGVNVDYDFSKASLSLGQWHFLAFVANSQTAFITFRQDGVVPGSFGYTGHLLTSSSQLNIGDDPSDTSPGQGNWDGKIDDLAPLRVGNPVVLAAAFVVQTSGSTVGTPVGSK